MSSLLSAELAATCSALGYYDVKSNKYYADSNTLETVKDLIRYLRRDDESHDIRRQLGEIKVLQNDLVPLLKSYWEETDLFDVILRLLVNLTTPALMLWHEEPPTDIISRNHFLQVEDHLKNYKQTFADETFWAVLSTRLSKILETSYTERGDENSLIIERILILVRNILYVPPDPASEKRTDNDASIHDQVLWALHQSGMLDIILFLTSSTNEKAYYMHTLEILSFMLREQKASELAKAALQRSETEKMRDEAELLAIRHRETSQRQKKMKVYNGARHSRFGGTYVLKSMKSISDNELIYHKPLNKLESLNFDADKKKSKTPKNRMPVQSNTFERRSAFSIRLFLKEFCVEFLNGAYNTLMFHVKDNLVRARVQQHDESYYLWALRFFMEFNRCYKFEVKLVSETMAVQTFRYVQQLMEKYFDMIQTDKKNVSLWSRRLHLALLAYRELLLTLCVMDKSLDSTVRDSSRVIKSNIFYILEYRELIVVLLISYDELKMSNAYLKDLMETQHVFLKLLESFCGSHGSVVVQKKAAKKKRNKAKKASQEDVAPPDVNLERRWDETAPQLSSVLEGNAAFVSDVVPFDAASDVPIDEQKSSAMINVQRKLRNGDFENAIGLLRAAREVWPENNCFGSNNMAPEEEFLALRDIFFADLGDDEAAQPVQEDPIYDENDEEEDEESVAYQEIDFKFEDFVARFTNPKVVRAAALALRDFQVNSINTNHCIIKLLHRIAFDCKMYVMIFQVSIFKTFQEIYANKDFPQYAELVKFATYIIRQFIKVAEVNKKVYMESLFWKNKGEAYDIEHGYNSNHQKVSAKGWSEQEEDELRRLFIEHGENQIEEDIVDWIVNNLIDNTRTRRGVLKKLKEMHLLVDYKGPKKSGVRGRRTKERLEWGEQEVEQLRGLYQRYADASDPIVSIGVGLGMRRTKEDIAEKLVELGLIQKKSQLLKKKKPQQVRPPSDVETNASSDSDLSENESTASAPVQKKNLQTRKKTSQNSKGSKARKSVPVVSDSRIAKLLLNIVSLEMSEALDWLKESFSDALEDFQSDDSCEGIPLVPIMDYAINAMENKDFQETLKALGVAEPFDEQESYWRIPGTLSTDLIKKYVDMLQQAIDNTLTIPEEKETDNQLCHSKTKSKKKREASGPSISRVRDDSEEEDVDFDALRRNFSRRVIDSDEEDARSQTVEKTYKKTQVDSDREDNVEEVNVSKKQISRRVVDSDDESEERELLVKNQMREEETIDDTSDKENEQTNISRRGRKLVDSDEEDSERELLVKNQVREEETIDDINEKENEETNISRRGRKLIDSDEEDDEKEPLLKKSTARKIIEDEEEEDDTDKRSRAESDSETEKPAPKRSRIISSDED